MTFSPASARRLLRSMRGQRVLVLGDVMLDEFVWGKVARISPEAPVPVVEVVGHSFHLGGAGNVASNLRSLGGDAVLAGVVGDDGAGQRVREELAAAGIEARLAVGDAGRPTTVKTRIIAHHQQVVRADRERADDVAGTLEERLLAEVRGALPTCRALVLSDYQKGVLTPRVTRAVLSLARRRRLPVLVDPKVRRFRSYRQVTVIKTNAREAEQVTGRALHSPADLADVGRRILNAQGCAAVLITRGEHGMSLIERGRPPLHIPTSAREVYDVTGAGDTVIAALALAVAAGARLPQAAALANHAAGVVVGKLGTATASPEELLAAVEAGAARA